jgi:hypothetical protein
MRRFGILFTAVLVAALCLAHPGVARAGGPEIRITGGGVADFLDPNPCDQFNTVAPFGESFFAVAARVDGRGRVSGTFICAVQNCFVGPGSDDFADIAIVGTFTDLIRVTRQGQDRVTLEGDGLFFISGVPGVADEFRFRVELREGGRGVGGFTYTDYVTELGEGIGYGDGLVDDGSDHEVITRGQIRIRFDD